MKKILLTALVAVSALAANAQVWVGGSLGFTSQDNDGAKTSYIQIAPEVGYTLTDGIDLAIKLGFRSTKPDGVDASTEFTINPYVRYTFYQTGAVGFFIDGGAEIVTTNSDVPGFDKAEVGFGIKPGLKFAASDKVTFVAHLGNLGYVTNWGHQEKYNRFHVGAYNGLDFGFYYSF